MQLTAILTRSDLASLVETMTPLRVELKDRPRRVVTFDPPQLVELVAGVGLRVRGGARFSWSIAGVPVPVTVRGWQVLLVPSIGRREGAHVLVFEPVLEELDFERLPAFAAQRITAVINEALGGQKHRLAWNFTRTLSYAHALPARVSPPMRFELRPDGGTVTVTEEEVRVTASFRAAVRRPADKRSRHSPPARAESR